MQYIKRWISRKNAKDPAFRLIALDLDNTLLRGDKSVSAFTIETLRRCKTAGVSIAFATARSLAATQRVAEQVRPDYLITCGGALVQAGERVLTEHTLAVDIANEIITNCRGLSSVGRILAELADGRYFVSNEVDPAAVGDYAHGVQFDFANPLPTDALKLVIQVADRQEALQAMAAFPSLETHCYTGSSWVFFAAPEATKWNGLQAVLQEMNASAGQVLSFGDDTGDLEMLQRSGRGVAMANAIPEVLAIADAVCGSNDADGVAHYLLKTILR